MKTFITCAVKHCLAVALVATVSSLSLAACGSEPCGAFDEDGQCTAPEPAPQDGDASDDETDPTDGDAIGSGQYGLYTAKVACDPRTNCCSTGTCRCCWQRDGTVVCSGICAPH